MKALPQRAKPTRWPAVFFTLLRICMGLLFVIAGVHKAIDPGTFLLAIRSFQVLADPWAPLTALCLPWLEILLGLCLLARRRYHASLLLAASLLALFLFAAFLAWARGLDIECGCLGPGSGTGDPLHLLARDLILLLAIAGLTWRSFAHGDEHLTAS